MLFALQQGQFGRRHAGTGSVLSSSTTWNPSDKTSGWSLSNGDLTATDSTSGLHSIRATRGSVSGDKFVWATKVTGRSSPTEHYTGVTNASQSISSIGSPYWLVRQDGTVFSGGGTSGGSSVTAPAVNDVEIWAYDHDAKKLWYGLNGTWAFSGNPAAGTGPAMTFTSADAFKALVQSFNNMTIDLLVGAQYPYSPPSGFTAY